MANSLNGGARIFTVTTPEYKLKTPQKVNDKRKKKEKERRGQIKYDNIINNITNFFIDKCALGSFLQPYYPNLF